MDHLQKNKTIIIICLVTIAAGITVVLGWILNVPTLQSIVPGIEPMRFNTALCFVFLGIALLLTQYQTRKYTLVFFILSLLVTFIGLITLMQNIFNFNTGLDQLFIIDKGTVSKTYPYPGRMAFNAALNFFLFGLGFLMLKAKSRLFDVLAQYLFHFITILTSVALIGYLYGVSLFYSFFYVSSMATHTALIFFILSIASSLLNPTIGITRMFTGNEVGNKMGKRLFILMLIPILVFGSLRVQSQHYRLFSLEIGISVLAVFVLLLSLLLIWDMAIRLNKIDAQRSEAEAEIKLMNASLEKRVKERTTEFQKSEEKYRSLIEHASDAIYVVDFKGNFIDVNASMCKMTGYTRHELLQLNVENIIDPEELKVDPVKHGPRNPGEYVIRERRLLRKDGSLFNAEVNVKMFQDDRILVIARDITSRKKMEAELREAELKFRTIAEKSMVGVYIVQDGKFVYVNPRFAEVFDYTSEELTNTVPVETIIDESYRHVTTENVRKRMAGEVESIRYEAMGKKKDGTTNWVEFYGSGTIIGNKPTIIGSMIDITERKKAEEELRSSEQKYKLLFESNPMPLWMIAKDDLSIIAVNDAAADLYGYTKDELLKMRVTELRPDEDMEKQLERYRTEAGSSTDFGIVRHLKKDRTIMFVQIISHDIIFDGKSVRLSLTKDVSEKLEAEELLRKSEANLQTILKTTDTAYALFDLDLKVLAFNQKAIEFVEEQFKHTPEKGDRLADLFPAARLPQFMVYTKEIFKGNNINYEIDYQQANGSILWYDVRLSPLTNDNKEILGMLMALYDITERKNAEEDLKRAYERIQSHINSIKDMAWKQSHLIRSPLANLKALATMIKDHPADAEVLEHFQTELDRMDAIIHEMADDASDHDI
ncbi:MAG: domain S-box protein [Mucilaginibacter sp.]|nr:domain S-box protein [Mucilaginibacter sp.]